jgi:hypothetical protein
MHVADDYDEFELRPARRRRGRKSGFVARSTLTHKVLFAWFNFRKSVRRLMAQRPTEGTLLKLLLWSDLAFFLSWTMKAVIVPNESGVSLVSIEIGLLFGLAIVIRTAAMYVFAMVAGAVCRIFGGRGTWRNTRIAVFWAAFVAAPFGVAAAMLSVAFTNLSVYYPIFGADWISLPPYYFGLLPLVWFTSIGIAQAHAFRNTSLIFLVMSVLSLVALLGGMYFHARGMI